MAKKTKNNLAYINRYNREHYKAVSVYFHKEKDALILADIQAQPNKQAYLRAALLFYRANKDK